MTDDPAVDVDAPAVLELEGIEAGYGRMRVLHGIDLRVGRGEILAVLGPNGAGKSTLLKVVAGSLAATAGRCLLNGTDLDRRRADQRARLGVCLIPEGRGVFPHLSVLDNLRVASHVGTSEKSLRDRAFAHFPQLADRRNQLAGTLSGGQQQMLALARGLATDPAVLLIDELSLGLAPIIVSELYQHVVALARAGLPVVLVEQFAELTLSFADRAIVVSNGRVTAAGTPAEVAPSLADVYLGGA